MKATLVTLGGAVLALFVPAMARASCDPGPTAFAGGVAAQNAVRTNANPAPNPAPTPLCWDDTVAATAQAWANSCPHVFMHTPNLLTRPQRHLSMP